jgi:hypothetical protein
MLIHHSPSLAFPRHVRAEARNWSTRTAAHSEHLHTLESVTMAAFLKGYACAVGGTENTCWSSHRPERALDSASCLVSKFHQTVFAVTNIKFRVTRRVGISTRNNHALSLFPRFLGSNQSGSGTEASI